MRFTDKVCLVTGGGSGIGKAACVQFAREGGKVVVVDVNEQHGNETVQEITQGNGEAVFAKCDVGNPDDVKAAIRIAVDHWQKIDILANTVTPHTQIRIFKVKFKIFIEALEFFKNVSSNHETSPTHNGHMPRVTLEPCHQFLFKHRR